MPQFNYKAINESGLPVTGTLEAESRQVAGNLLATRGLIPVKIFTRAANDTSGLSFNRFLDRLSPIKTAELIMFTKQFKTLTRAGVPMLNLLQVLETQTENQRLKRIIATMRRDITEGASLYDAFRRHYGVFSGLYCSMVRAGEASGALDRILERLIYILEHENKVKADIRAALQYPLFITILLGAAFMFLLTFVVPKFTSFYAQSGVDLPLLTRICIFMYDVLIDYWIYLLTLAIGGVTALVLYLRTPQGKLNRDILMLKIPLIGPLLLKASMSRFASIFSILQSSGVAVLDSMQILSQTIHNHAIGQEFQEITEKLEEGRGIAGPLQSSRYFTPIVINMIAIGEESGNLESMLDDIADHYDAELEYATKKLADSIVPVLTVLLAVVVGFFALAIYLPIVDLINVQTNFGP
jgi:type IV pilus assembly protein PilC